MMQEQIQMKEAQKAEAYEQYCKERDMVDQTVERMIQEDLENMKLIAEKKQKAESDMLNA